MRTEWWIDQDTDEYDNARVRVRYYPEPEIRRRPAWLSNLTEQFGQGPGPQHERVYSFLQEIYSAINSGSEPRLVIMGIRSLIEQIMVMRCGNDHGNFSLNLQAVQTAREISSVQAQQLQKVIEMGHAVTHRPHVPSVGDIALCMDIVESVVCTLYLHGDQARALGLRTPLRPKRRDGLLGDKVLSPKATIATTVVESPHHSSNKVVPFPGTIGTDEKGGADDSSTTP